MQDTVITCVMSDALNCGLSSINLRASPDTNRPGEPAVNAVSLRAPASCSSPSASTKQLSPLRVREIREDAVAADNPSLAKDVADDAGGRGTACPFTKSNREMVLSGRVGWQIGGKPMDKYVHGKLRGPEGRFVFAAVTSASSFTRSPTRRTPITDGGLRP